MTVVFQKACMKFPTVISRGGEQEEKGTSVVNDWAVKNQ